MQGNSCARLRLFGAFYTRLSYCPEWDRIWRVASASINYDFNHVDPDARWGEWTDENYTIYPNTHGHLNQPPFPLPPVRPPTAPLPVGALTGRLGWQPYQNCFLSVAPVRTL